MDGCSGEGEDCVEADGAEQSGLAGHVGAADEIEACVGIEGDVVADAGLSGDERVAEGGRAELAGLLLWQKSWVDVFRMFEGVVGEGAEGFELSPCGHPLLE